MNFDTIAVIGAGTMGSGIAQLLAQNKYSTLLYDAHAEALTRGLDGIHKRLQQQEQKGRLSSIQHKEATHALTTTTDLAALQTAGLLIEAIPERLDLKKQIFAQLDRIAQGDSVLASNTSGLDIDQLAMATQRPEQVIGLHFFNPPPLMPLIEIARGSATSDRTFAAVHALALSLGKTPIAVANRPGFAVNRILFPMINEAIYALAEGVASAEDIDRAMQLGASHPLGPLALADFVGLDVTLDILNALERDLADPKYRACPLLCEKVERGELGRKSGRGFFTYS
jgi:3-hydroxybutyryl-CoA dehydrogenase